MGGRAFLGSEPLELAGSTPNAYATANGDFAWSFQNSSPMAASPIAVESDQAVIADEDGYVSIVRRPGPQLLWRAFAGDEVGAGPYPVETGMAVAHGLIVVPATNRLTVFG
jgi:outer membrane protein assembly factor BamB